MASTPSSTTHPKAPVSSESHAGLRKESRVLYWTAFAIFLLAAFATIKWAHAMGAGMPMPGGWKMSMMWMMHGSSPLLDLATFSGMWLTMMVAMMLPSSLPVLLLFRRVSKSQNEPHPDLMAWSVALGYFAVWTAFGVAAYFAGRGIAQAAMKWRGISASIPLACGVALVISGIYQLTPVKAACLRHCRDPLLVVFPHSQQGRSQALLLGIHHGAFCVSCCWALMVIQLVLGVMNLAIMAAVAIVIAAEKLLPRGLLLARVVGAGSIVAGLIIFYLSLK